ncbi:hypothetical protein BFO01nite_49460 [Brevibacillus formosus]|uniref:Uncharacterized protein n=1 Tax=Brevibacillus formosus TaxID=54913 RepID=A0ABQ0TDP4_9BACL|nr:hypothetical protein BFO01nite_49460 [Brevibacillus formosus]
MVLLDEIKGQGYPGEITTLRLSMNPIRHTFMVDFLRRAPLKRLYKEGVILLKSYPPSVKINLPFE